MSANVKRVFFATALPLVWASTPTGRWGHQAVYVPSQQAMYIIGGQVVSSGAEVTNDVLVLPVSHPCASSSSWQLNETGPSFSAGPNTGLPPHAFAAATLSEGGKSLMVLGGMTSSCSSDALAHSLDLTSGAGEWTHANPTSFVRRRGAEAAWIDDGSADGVVTVVGGVADTYSCCRLRVHKGEDGVLICSHLDLYLPRGRCLVYPPWRFFSRFAKEPPRVTHWVGALSVRLCLYPRNRRDALSYRRSIGDW